ncbi:MAG TPA: hypothetical protein VIT65_06815 [Microlunatus sp.]
MNGSADEDMTTTAAETRRLWLQALAELDPRHADRSWYPSAHDLALSLCAAADDERSLLSLINQALVLQQFLLEVACRPTRVGDRTAIVRQADRLLNQTLVVPA